MLLKSNEEFPSDKEDLRSNVATAVAWVIAVAPVWSLAWEFLYASGRAKKKKKTEEKEKNNRN